MGVGVIPHFFKKVALTKLWELPLSTSVSITLFFTKALSFNVSPSSVPLMAFGDKEQNSVVRESSKASCSKTSYVRVTSKLFNAKALT
jgi:hypothetical protein